MKLWPFKTRSQEPALPTHHRREPTLTTRSYRAAFADRLASGFKPFGTTTRDETRREIRGLVAHSRHAAHNFDNQRSYEMLFRRHVIGPNGIRLKMDVRESDGQKDLVANAAIEAAWTKWAKMGNPSICGRLSWWGIECQIATAVAREGGAFIRIHEGLHRGAFGFQVEPIPFDLLDIDLTHRLTDNSYIESGIEFNEDGRVLAFHVWSAPLTEGHRPQRRRRIRVPAREMVHVLIPEEIGQALGVPRSSTALRLMNMSEKFQEAAMAAATYGAAQMLFFTQEDTSGQIGSTETETPIDEIEAGTVGLLPPGGTPEWSDSKYPDQAMEPFMRHMGTSQASGLGVSYETLTSDLSRANFSTLRAGKGEERDEWRMCQRAIWEGMHGIIFSRWLPFAIISGQLRLPFSKLAKFDAATWRPRGWQSVNPKDDATANAQDLASGNKSLTEVIADRGRSLEDVLDERAAEVEAFRSRGLSPPEWSGTFSGGSEQSGAKKA